MSGPNGWVVEVMITSLLTTTAQRIGKTFPCLHHSCLAIEFRLHFKITKNLVFGHDLVVAQTPDAVNEQSTLPVNDCGLTDHWSHVDVIPHHHCLAGDVTQVDAVSSEVSI